MKVKILCDEIIHQGRTFAKGNELDIKDEKTVELLVKEKSVEIIKKKKEKKDK